MRFCQIILTSSIKYTTFYRSVHKAVHLYTSLESHLESRVPPVEFLVAYDRFAVIALAAAAEAADSPSKRVCLLDRAPPPAVSPTAARPRKQASDSLAQLAVVDAV